MGSRSGSGVIEAPIRLLTFEDWSGVNTVLAGTGAAIYGLGFSVPPPMTAYGAPTPNVCIRGQAPLTITAAGNGALALVLEEFTSGVPVVVASQYYSKAFLAGTNSQFDAFPPVEYFTQIIGAARQFALWGYLLIDAGSLLTAQIRSASGGVPVPRVTVDSV